MVIWIRPWLELDRIRELKWEDELFRYPVMKNAIIRRCRTRGRVSPEPTSMLMVIFIIFISSFVCCSMLSKYFLAKSARNERARRIGWNYVRLRSDVGGCSHFAHFFARSPVLSVFATASILMLVKFLNMSNLPKADRPSPPSS